MAKFVKPLNDTQLKKLKSSEQRYKVADGNNLYIVVSNSSKIWQFIYTHPTTKKRVKKNLGAYPALALTKAREKARYFQSLLVEGVDPFEYQEKQAEMQKKNAITVREMADIWKEKKKLDVQEKTFKDLWFRLERWLFPRFGNVAINEVTLPVVIKTFQPAYQEHPDTIRKVCSYFVSILDRAVILGYLPHNPLSSMRGEFKKPVPEHQPTIHYTELSLFMKRLIKAHSLPLIKLLIEWQLLTMVRPNEASCAEWAEIDFNKKIWNIPAYKMKGLKDRKKPHSVPLSNQALELLNEIKKHSFGYSLYLFPNRNDINRPASSGSANAAIQRIDNGSYHGKLTAHGMRSIARTYLADIGVDHFVSESCLSHATGDSTSRAYNRSNYLEQRREAMQKWGDFVEKSKNY